MQNSQKIDIIVSYEEYLNISSKAKKLQLENQGLKDSILMLNTQLQRQHQEILVRKECEHKLKVLSMNHLKALKMVLKLQNQQTQLQNKVKQKQSLLAQKQNILQTTKNIAQQLQKQVIKLKDASLLHLATIQTPKQQLISAQKLRDQHQRLKQQMSQLVKQTQKNCKKYIRLQDQLRRREIQARIMIQDDRDQELQQLRQKIKAYEQQLTNLRKQNQESAKQISSLQPIIERYYDWLQNPQSKLLMTFCLTLQHFREKLLKSGQSSQILKHLQVKKKAIDYLLEKEYRKIMQTSTLMFTQQ